jgi:hypothetical protein
MISVLELFKIIFGIIFSVFVIVLIFRFSTNYIEMGDSNTQANIMLGFRKTVGDVYASGIPADYAIKDSRSLIVAYTPPEIHTKVATVSMEPVTTIFVPGDKLGIHRMEYDLGWWKYYYIEALPETTVFFNPLSNSEEVWSDIYGVVKSLPSSENIATKMYFGLGCNSTSDQGVFTNWEREKILKYEKTMFTRLSEAGFTPVICGNFNREWKTIVVSPTFTETGHPLMFTLSNGTGMLYMNTSQPEKAFFYKTPMDVVSAILGGEDLYDYENRDFLAQLALASSLKMEETGLLMQRSASECLPFFEEFRTTLESLRGLASQDYNDPVKMGELAIKMEESRQRFLELQVRGCE